MEGEVHALYDTNAVQYRGITQGQMTNMYYLSCTR